VSRDRNLQPDHGETLAEARAALSRIDGDAWSLSRRRFLQGALVAAAMGGTKLALPSFLRSSSTASAATDNILVVLSAPGGIDMLNVFVPKPQLGQYQSLRGSLAVSEANTLPLGNDLLLNNKLPYLKQLYDAGQVAVLQNIGYANSSFSHFDSMAIWMGAKANVNTNVGFTNGWVGRWADGVPGDDMAIVNIGDQVPLHFVGRTRRSLSLPRSLSAAYGAHAAGTYQTKLYSAVRAMAGPTGLGTIADSMASVAPVAMDIGAQLMPAFGALGSLDNLARDMTLAASLINLNAGIRVIGVEYVNHDTHADEATVLSANLGYLNSGLQAFYSTLSPAMQSKVTILTLSEFGRTVRANDSGGCDHGTVSVQMAIGARVKGGTYGTYASLSDLQNGGSQFKFTTSSMDFRVPMATMVEKWLGGDVSDVFAGSVPTIDLFRVEATAVPGAPPVPGAPAARGTMAVNAPLDATNLQPAKRLSVGQSGALSAAYGAVAVSR
jgi:uncharacterized protein (DUF1501 family)